jgi:hypothetical protein
MRAAVTILIERLATHPDEFFGVPNGSKPYRAMEMYEAKFRSEALQIERHIIGAKDKDDTSYDAYWFLTQEEKDALHAAYTEARRARFDADIIHALMAQPEPEQARKSAQVLTAGVITNQALKIMDSEFARTYSGGGVR